MALFHCCILLEVKLTTTITKGQLCRKRFHVMTSSYHGILYRAVTCRSRAYYPNWRHTRRRCRPGIRSHSPGTSGSGTVPPNYGYRSWNRTHPGRLMSDICKENKQDSINDRKWHLGWLVHENLGRKEEAEWKKERKRERMLSCVLCCQSW